MGFIILMNISQRVRSQTKVYFSFVLLWVPKSTNICLGNKTTSKAGNGNGQCSPVRLLLSTCLTFAFRYFTIFASGIFCPKTYSDSVVNRLKLGLIFNFFRLTWQQTCPESHAHLVKEVLSKACCGFASCFGVGAWEVLLSGASVF